jgi:thermostable 8-oxoguanine DNA glycosylase
MESVTMESIVKRIEIIDKKQSVKIKREKERLENELERFKKRLENRRKRWIENLRKKLKRKVPPVRIKIKKIELKKKDREKLIQFVVKNLMMVE